MRSQTSFYSNCPKFREDADFKAPQGCLWNVDKYTVPSVVLEFPGNSS